MARRSFYTKKLGAVVANTKPVIGVVRYHVISGEANKWSVVAHGSVHPVKVFSSRDEAIQFAKQTASRQTGEVIIHAQTGQIRDRISFV
jgi:hypothetical protein